jgi:hypothetical protein
MTTPTKKEATLPLIVMSLNLNARIDSIAHKPRTIPRFSRGDIMGAYRVVDI